MSTAQDNFDNSGMGLDPEEDARRYVSGLRDLLQSYPRNKKVVGAAQNFVEYYTAQFPDGEAQPLKITPAPDISMPLPNPMLSAVDRDGVILGVGEIMILSSEGGAGKSSLMAGLAVEIAAVPNGEYATLAGGFLAARGCRVLIMSYEDPPAIIRKKVESMAAIRSSQMDHDPHMGYLPFGEAAQRVLVVEEMDLDDMYGQNPEIHINTRPVPLPMWFRFWQSIPEDLGLIILDPSLAAYSGDPNSVSHIRQFIRAMTREARKRGISVIILHHSAKNNRGKAGTDDFDEWDLFDPGQIMGSTGWHDGTRCVMTLGGRRLSNLRKLAIMKASWGEETIVIDLQPIRLTDSDDWRFYNMIVGFNADGEWRSPRHSTDDGQTAPNFKN